MLQQILGLKVKGGVCLRTQEEVSVSEPCFKKKTKGADLDQTLLSLTQEPVASSTMLLTNREMY